MIRLATALEQRRSAIRRLTEGCTLTRGHHGLMMGAGSGPVDPDFSSVVALLHMDGTDGSTTFTDQKGHTFTPNGNAQLDTADFMFGTASMLGDGTGDYLESNASADFALGTGNFTVELWAKLTVGTTQEFFGISSSSSGGRGVMLTRLSSSSGRVQASVFDTGDNLIVNIFSAGSGFSLNVWHHIALVRNGTTFTLYRDGTSVGTPATSSSTVGGSATPRMYVGRNTAAGPGTALQGWLDEVRVTRGVARYTSNFTPPAAAFPDQ